jgi:hypothetical protein
LKYILRGLVSALTTLLLVTTAMPPASAADVSPPEFVSVSMTSPKVLGVGDRICFSYTARDNVGFSGAQPASFTFGRPTDKYVHSMTGTFSGSTSPVEGTLCSYPVDSFTWPNGTYRLLSISIKDGVGNSSGNFPAFINPDDFSVTVQGTAADVSPPEFVSVSMTSPKVLGVGDRICFSYTATDNVGFSGAQPASFTFGRPTDKYVHSMTGTFSGSTSPVEGTLCSYPVDSFTWPNGTYRLLSISIKDGVGNSSGNFPAFINPDEFTVTVQGTAADVSPPEFVSVSMTSPKVLGLGDRICFSYTARDNVGFSGAQPASFTFGRPTDKYVHSMTGTFSGSTSPVEGTLCSYPVDSFTWPNGTYRLLSISIKDGVGNSSGNFPAFINPDDFTVTVQGTDAPSVVVPAAIVFVDRDGSAFDTYTIPATVGVDYVMDDRTVPAGTYAGTGTVGVIARAKPGYVLAEGATTSWTVTFKSIFGPAMSVSRDLNGDGKADVLARDSSGALWLYPGNGKGGWLTRVRVGSGWNVMSSIVGPGDLNGDGKADVLARDSSGALWLYPGNGKGGWLTRVRVGSGWNVMSSIVGPGDLNGDGKADVLARDSSGALWLYPGNGKGGWLTRVRVGSGWNVMSSIVGPGDLNGDGKADVLARDSSGALWLYPGNGKGGWLTHVRVGSGWNVMSSIVGPGDLNGDGKADVLARDSSGALWLYPGNGKGGWLTRVRVGSGWNVMTSIV